MLSTSKDANENYLCKIITCGDVKEVVNSDNLSFITVDHLPVIVGRDTNPKEVRVFFPAESAVSHKLLSELNEYRIEKDGTTLNRDPNATAGWFDKNRRVRAVTFRGQKSNGYTIPITDFERVYGVTGLANTVGDYFDSVNGEVVVEKYVSQTQLDKEARELRQANKGGQAAKRVSRLIEGQHRFHDSTTHLRKHVGDLNLNDIISISDKVHGTSFNVSNVLVIKKLSFWEKVLKRMGFNIQDRKYDIIAGSRKVVKNKYLNDPKNGSNGYYGEDIYVQTANELAPHIPKGYSLYGEYVGYTPNGKFIQGDFDYGCKPGEHKLYIYRITNTNPDGIVIDLSNEQIRHFCDRQGLEMTKLFYEGTVENFLKLHNIKARKDWHTPFINKMEELYNGNMEPTNIVKKVPAEGVVVRVENRDAWTCFKFKDFTFTSKYS